MKSSIIFSGFLLWAHFLTAQFESDINLLPPDTSRGLPVMKALALRASTNDYNTAELSDRDLSDLLWAANGINRPENGKRTAPSALNSQDIDIYAVMSSGIYLYNPKEHSLQFLYGGDYRSMVASQQENFAHAPVFLLLVSDISRFARGSEEQKMTWAAEDAGIVSQNISLYCAGVNLATRPRASMDREKLQEILQLNGSRHLMLNHPVGYKK